MKFKRLRSKGGKEVSELHRPKVGIRSLQGVGTVQNYVLLRITYICSTYICFQERIICHILSDLHLSY